ncbi:MAG: hypothetical protein LBP58_09295 [Azoarcus sp.]|jgi:hypothetical protein|nr:hypothetical protein [Azoarcus sp.]
MTSNTDWVPSSEDGLIKLIAVWSTKLSNTSTQTAYGWVAAECTATIATITAFNTAYTTYHTTPTQINRMAKDEAKKTLITALRKFAAERIRSNSKMTPPQRLELGVTTRDTVPTPIPVPHDGPESEAETNPNVPGVIRVRYKGAKPYGVDHFNLGYLISDVPITEPTDLLHMETFSHNPWEHTFTTSESGKTLYYALRYVTREGVSHWSKVQRVVIP